MQSFASYLKDFNSSFKLIVESKQIEKELAVIDKDKKYIQSTGRVPIRLRDKFENKSKCYDWLCDEHDRLNQEINEIVPADILSDKKFVSWFKGSKVVDRKGNPLKMYHGSKADIKEFNLEYSESATGSAQFGAGHYFTTNPTTASGYGSTVYPVYLSIKKPLSADSKKGLTRMQIESLIRSSPDFKDSLWNYGDVGHDGERKVTRMAVESFFEGQDTLLSTLFSINNDFYKDLNKEFAEAVKSVLGYDGVRAEMNEETWWIVFTSEQIKSIFNKNFNKKSKLISE